MSPRTKLKSVSLAAGYETSISFSPHATRVLKNRVFCSIVIGFARAWLPSRRSVDSHIGAVFCTRAGHCRFGMSSGVYALYFFEGSALQLRVRGALSMADSVDSQHRHGGGRGARS